MDNRILDAYVATRRASPTDAELRIVVRTERLTPATEIKGRLMGPRSPYAGTVEIAYPLREVARTDHILMRVLIPEPNFWEPATPLLYEGPLELWQDGALCEQIELRHGIRTLQLGSQGLRVNGKLCPLRGVSADTFTDDEARRWHAEGINLVLIPARDDTMDLWRLSDRFGLLVLGRIEEPHQWPRWPLACQRYPSFLGCVSPVGFGSPAGPGLFGGEVTGDENAMYGKFDFILGDALALAAFPVSGVPGIVVGEHPPDGVTLPKDVIGWIRRAW
jgi:hypothetical protein